MLFADQINQRREWMQTEVLLRRTGNHPIVTVFGSSRLTPETTAYREAVAAGKLLAQNGFAVLTGGGPGIMEAANKGAYEAGGVSLSACIHLPFREDPNPYVSCSAYYNTFAPRKDCLMKKSAAFLVFPGGYGTGDELFEILTLQATGKLRISPIILVGRKYWEPLAQWLRNVVEQEFHCISRKELEFFQIVENADDAVARLMTVLPVMTPPAVVPKPPRFRHSTDWKMENQNFSEILF